LFYVEVESLVLVVCKGVRVFAHIAALDFVFNYPEAGHWSQLCAWDF